MDGAAAHAAGRHRLHAAQPRSCCASAAAAFGLVPMQGGAASAKVADEEKDAPLEPGGPLAVAMITGDFDLSGIGTVTHIEGNRVYGWGHPFMGLGACEFPLMTGYIHTIYPRQTVSFKMGSPLKTVGVVNADVSTCIAGWLDRKPDMLPVQHDRGARPTRARRGPSTSDRPAAVADADAGVHGPDQLGGHGRRVARGNDGGIRGPRSSWKAASRSSSRTCSPASAAAGRRRRCTARWPRVVSLLTNNPYEPLRITADRVRHAGVSPAGARPTSSRWNWIPTPTSRARRCKATVFVRPYKGVPRRLTVTLKLPDDLPEGDYTVTVCDDVRSARLSLRDDPNLSNPQNVEQVLRGRPRADGRRSGPTWCCACRCGATGVAVGGKIAAATCRPSMVQILGDGRRTGAQPIMRGALSSQPADRLGDPGFRGGAFHRGATQEND